MCLKPPKPPKVPKQAPLPIVKQMPIKQKRQEKDIPKERLLREEGEEAKVTYGSKPSDALLSKNPRGSSSIVSLNKNALNTAGASQQGLGGTAA